MNLTKQESEVLENIQEGINDTHQIKVFMNIQIDKIKEIFLKLEKAGLIKVQKKFDKFYKEDYWNAKIVRKSPIVTFIK